MSPRGRAGRSHVVHKLIDWLLPGPRDATEQRPLNLGIREIRVRVALHPHERPGRLTAREGVFVRPDLRHDFALVVAGARVAAISAVASTWMAGFFAHVIMKKASSQIVMSDMSFMMGFDLSTTV